MALAEGKVAIIAIGRNEGQRLKRSLESVKGLGCPIVYVDSGSTDNSLEIARQAGVDIVELDMSIPFSAARARNAGAERALSGAETPKYLQFIDGDCAIAAGWLDAAVAHFEAHDDVVLVTGWRREIDRNASVFNAMCDVEWHRPAGEIEVAGGDVMVRAAAHEKVGGYDPTVIAGEDPDYCLRLGAFGTRVRLPLDMTLHDAAMTRFGQWWQRAVRAGHAYAHLNTLHPGLSRRELMRAWVFAVVLPLFAVVSAVVWPVGVAIVGAGYAVSYLNTVRGLLRHEGQPLSEALHHAIFLTLSKFPNVIGMLTFYQRRLKGQQMRIIEYK